VAQNKTAANGGKVAIVTGGASGIGFAFSQALADAGFSVVIADLHGADGAAAKLRAKGRAAAGLTADVASEPDAEAMARVAREEFGGVDVLVNNAGLFTALALKPFDQISNDEWRRVMEVNTLGPFNCAKAVLPALRERGGGRIINIASTTAIKGTPMMLHYVASKGAVIGFTRALARELGAQGITVNAIAPGFTLSEGVLQAKIHEVIGDAARRTSRSIQRDQVPADLIGALLFLAGDGAAFITGQTIAVDGGGVFL
jgi:NAD(P)-dependent dehydrogenase (short-subunit alcohol dehydrogenase family)